MISDDIRAAVAYVETCGSCTCDDCVEDRALVTRLRAHADLLERIEREMRDPENVPFGGLPQLDEWADALAGEAT